METTMTPTHPESELVALLVSDDMVQIAIDASDAYWAADDRQEKCLACNGTGKVPCGESQDWCNCDNGTLNNGTEAGAMRAALEAVEATRAATVPQGVWLPIEQGGRLPEVGEWASVLTDTHAGSRPDLLFLTPDKPRFRVIPAQLRSVDNGWPVWQRWEMASGHPCGLLEGDTHWQPLPTPPPAELGKGS